MVTLSNASSRYYLSIVQGVLVLAEGSDRKSYQLPPSYELPVRH